MLVGITGVADAVLLMLAFCLIFGYAHLIFPYFEVIKWAESKRAARSCRL